MSTKRLKPRLVKPGEEMISPERPAQDISSTVASFRRDMQSHIREMDGKIREVSDAIADIEEAHRRMLLNIWALLFIPRGGG